MDRATGTGFDETGDGAVVEAIQLQPGDGAAAPQPTELLRRRPGPTREHDGAVQGPIAQRQDLSLRCMVGIVDDHQPIIDVVGGEVTVVGVSHEVNVATVDGRGHVAQHRREARPGRADQDDTAVRHREQGLDDPRPAHRIAVDHGVNSSSRATARHLVM